MSASDSNPKGGVRHVALASVLAVATALRLVVLDNWGLWLDEIYTVDFRGTGSLDTILYVPYDPHPPLYFLLVKLWSVVFGADPTVVRGLSLVVSVAAVAGAYALGKQLYDAETGVVTALLLAVVPVHVHFGRIARMYSLVVLLTVTSCYLYVRLAERSRWLSAAYVATSAALLYTHVYGVFIVTGHAAHAFWEAYTGPDTPEWRRVGTIYGAIGLLYLPWGAILASQVVDMLLHPKSPTASVGWIPAPSVRLVLDTVRMFAGDPWLYPVSAGSQLTGDVVLFVLVVFLAAVVLALLQAPPEDWDSNYDTFLGISVLSPTLLPLIVSLLVTPIYYPRFTLPATVPLAVLVAHGVSSLKHVGYLLVVLLAVSSLFLTASYDGGETVEPWESSTAFVERNTNETAIVGVQPAYAKGFFEYYYSENASLLGMPPDVEDRTQQQQARIETAVENDRRVCVFQYSAATATPANATFQTTVRPYASFEKGKIRVQCFANDTA